MKASLCLLLFCVMPAAAGVRLEAAHWQLLVGGKGRDARRRADIERLALTPGVPLEGRLLARVGLRNRGPVVEGLLLRYAVEAKVERLVAPGSSPVWALPYLLDEKRVPLAPANQVFEATVDPTSLTKRYLQALRREGYWPVELRIRFMLKPRLDDQEPLRIVEAALPIGR
ncbi:MAG: hypothetical protein KGO96_00615 [Elusimicrobia bacterium]|nr:hypothetical protein [Elusimicrobiota bacterium]MDE2237772.1 hypothetical protein [Elusimicrobiota bacterium]MDE2424396.1 hypothetical protein [Elusimicrobiota bacterium]